MCRGERKRSTSWFYGFLVSAGELSGWVTWVRKPWLESGGVGDKKELWAWTFARWTFSTFIVVAGHQCFRPTAASMFQVRGTCVQYNRSSATVAVLLKTKDSRIYTVRPNLLCDTRTWIWINKHWTRIINKPECNGILLEHNENSEKCTRIKKVEM